MNREILNSVEALASDLDLRRERPRHEVGKPWRRKPMVPLAMDVVSEEETDGTESSKLLGNVY